MKIIIDMLKKCLFCGSKNVVRNGLRGRPNGTNAKIVAVILMAVFEGLFSDLKTKVRVHSGISKEDQKKLLDEYIKRDY